MNRTESELPPTLNEDPLHKRHQPSGLSDNIAFGLTKFLRFFADSFFAKRYGHRDVNHCFADNYDRTTK